MAERIIPLKLSDFDYAEKCCCEKASLAAEIERLRAALERMLLEFDFMIESGVISDVRNDIIFVEARAALEGRT